MPNTIDPFNATQSNLNMKVQPLGIAGLLWSRVQETPEAVALTYLRNGGAEAEVRTFAALDREARAVAAWLRLNARPGDRVLLAHAPGPEFVSALFGCLYAGCIAVPTYPPRKTRHGDRVSSVVQDAGCALALADSVGCSALEMARAGGGAWAGLRWPEPGELERLPTLADAALHRPEPGDVAILQYTSGSTGKPKGVMVTHANVAHNLAAQAPQLDFRPNDVMVSWIPFFHDLGLVLGVLFPLHCQGSGVYMAPNDFLKHPLAWLKALSDYRGTHSVVPNFAFDLCARCAPEAEGLGLDLSHWRWCCNGSEPVREEPMRRFEAAYARYGLSPDLIQPCYGMAENTLYISGSGPSVKRVLAPVDSGNILVGCGTTRFHTVVIVDPVGLKPNGDGETGEIWVQSPSTAKGYWNKPEETAATFGAKLEGHPGSFLRTGDMGFYHGGQLVISGRLKDLIIVRGVNHHPEDLEATAQDAVPGLGAAAAFSLEDSDGERVVLALEVGSCPPGERTAAARRIAAAINQAHGIALAELLLLGRPGIPMTSSGKIQRRACREAYLKGELKVLLRWPETPGPVPYKGTSTPGSGSKPSFAPTEQPKPAPAEGTQQGLRRRCPVAVESLWAFQMAFPLSTAYHLCQSLKLKGCLDPQNLRQALQKLAELELALRCGFIADEQDRLWQQDGPAIVPLDLPGPDPLDPGRAREWIRSWSRAPFRLERGPLWRAAYLPLNDGGSTLAFVFHHLIFDRGSGERFYTRLERLLADPKSPLDTAPGFEDAIPEASGGVEASRAYWGEQLRGLEQEPWLLPSASDGDPGRTEAREAAIPAAVVDSLKRLAVRGKCTLFTVAAVAWAEALAEASGTREACFLIPTTLRKRPPLESALGYWVHPVPLRLEVHPGMDLPRRLARAWATLQSSLSHRGLSAAQAMRTVGLPVPAAVLNYHGEDPEQRLAHFAGMPSEFHSEPVETAIAPLGLEVVNGRDWRIRLEYLPERVAPRFAQRCLEAFIGACHRYAVGGVKEPLSLLQGPEPPTTGHATVLDAFHDHARRAPEAPALLFRDGQVDYGTLESQVYAVAGVLFQAGVLPGDRVGVCSSASPAWVAAFLGCFEASAVYVPLDPAYPPERLKGMLEDSGCSVVLSDQKRPAWTSGWAGPWMDLEQALKGKLPYHRRAGQPRPEDPAYLIFTSGSTGRPKGVLVGHRALLNNALGIQSRLGLANQDRVMQFSSISFDASIQDVTPTLAAGACLCLLQRRGAPGAAELGAFVRTHGVSLFLLPTAYWHAFMQADGAKHLANAPRLRLVMVGGEAPGPEFVAQWRRHLPGVALFNAYGPTEACVCVTLYECGSETPERGPIPLGQALCGVELAVVDPEGRCVKRGRSGELWIAGVCLADGYLRPGADLDRARFAPGSPDLGPSRAFYRTGDMARIDEDGTLVHLGRMDREVKVSGVRVDLGEVESVLAGADGVAVAVVEPDPTASESRLKAWVLVQQGHRPEAAELKNWLAQRIHSACIPSEIAVLDSFPLGPNGKIDRAALVGRRPESRPQSLPEAAAADTPAGPVQESPEPVAPSGPALERLREAFGLVLGRSVGPDEDFFALGGSSLQAVRLAGEAGRRLGLDVPVEQIYRAPNPRALAGALSARGGCHGEPRAALKLLAPGPGPAWVLLPPSSGRLVPYLGLARALEGRAQVWGLDLSALPAPAEDAWDAWVDACAEAIQSALPAGDVVLGGWSMGGLLATDLCRSLAARGRRTARLLLMDAYAPDPLARALALHDPFTLEDLVRRDLGTGNGEALEDISEEERRRYMAHLRATARYALRPIAVPVSLALSERTAREEARGSWMAWSLMARAGMTCRLIPGDHHNILAEGNVRRLAEFLLQGLAQGAEKGLVAA